MLSFRHFMRDETWSVLDLLAVCVSFCALAAYITTSEPVDRNVVGAEPDLEGGRPQPSQANQMTNHNSRQPRGLQPEGEAHEDSLDVGHSIQSDVTFVIDDDSMIGDTDPPT